ncbi:SRPBCC family protein [Paenibacillus sp. N1-5-1-14]|uniref:SRPBCC family protein n=1 Tax=Paenibacillus radicibacter TaxID=2972488 RepID=UPI002158B4C0|nr:SRPBCC family protein [Paenibacillus radicibacter]MCR8644330.1 SRPBCC family protein [Paenibacillus radicibacter]
MVNSFQASHTAQIVGRELIVSRLFQAPRELVFSTWTNPEHLPQWWGPSEFTITTQEINVREGGVWNYIMHGPDGVDYDNQITYHQVVSPEIIEYSHGESNDPEQFRVFVTFEDQDGHTALTMRSIFRSAEELEFVAREYGAVEASKSTLDRLEQHIQSLG